MDLLNNSVDVERKVNNFFHVDHEIQIQNYLLASKQQAISIVYKYNKYMLYSSTINCHIALMNKYLIK